MLTAQVGTAFAAPALQEGNITGTVDTVTCETDETTGAITFLVTVTGEDETSQTVPVDEETTATLGIITSETVCNSDGTVDGAVTGLEISIAPTEEEAQHPVGHALSLFFEGIADYETIMQAHDGEFEEFGSTGFGMIAQALWLTKNLEDGSEEDFLAILEAKKTGDYTEFFPEGDVTNWRQFKKALLDGAKKNNLGEVMSDKENKTNKGKGPGAEKSNSGKGKND